MPIDQGFFRSVPWTPPRYLWLVPFTAATGAYAITSALALAVRRPLRWMVGIGLGYVFLGYVGALSGVESLATVPSGVLEKLFYGPFGFDTLLTARTESLHTEATLTTGKKVGVWLGLPVFKQWIVATLLWTGGGLLALWAAASMRREGTSRGSSR